MFVTGVMGKFIEIMPIAVIAMLVISLVESTFILALPTWPTRTTCSCDFCRIVFYIFKPLMVVLSVVSTEWRRNGLELVIDNFINLFCGGRCT